MNEPEGSEFEQLKLQHQRLERELRLLAVQMDHLENRLSQPKPAAVQEPEPPRPTPVAVPRPVPRAIPMPPPPIIPPIIQPAPAPAVAKTKAATLAPRPPETPPAQRPSPPVEKFEKSFLKGLCRACGGHLEFPAERVGDTISCPHCGQSTLLSAAAEAIPIARPISTAVTARPERAAERPAPIPKAPTPSLEMRLGTYWAPRVGIVLVLTALVFFGNLAYQNYISKLGPAGKITLLYLASAALLVAGAWWQRKAAKESLKNYAQVLFAGGLAAVYFTTYAAHHLEAVLVIRNAGLDGALLLLWAGFMVWCADRKKSEVLAFFAVGLAYYTSIITRVGYFTLYSNLVLTAAAVFFLVRNRWAALSFASLVATYAAYAFWRFFNGTDWHWASPEEGLWTGTWFLMSYWIAFTSAVFLSKDEKFAGQNRAGFLTLNNGAFFTMFVLTMLQVRHGGFWKFSLSYGTVLLILAELARRIFSAEPQARNAYLTQGLLLVTVGFIAKFTGLDLALILAAESVILLMLGQQRRNIILLTGAYITAALAVAWGMDGMRQFDRPGLWLGMGLGALMLLNTILVHRQFASTNPSGSGTALPAVPAFLRPQTSYFTVLALLIWLVATYDNTTPEAFPVVVAAESVLLTLSVYLLGVREIALFGQGYLVLAQLVWLIRFALLSEATTPWWNPALLIAISLGLGQWWWRQKILMSPRPAGPTLHGSYALAITVLALLVGVFATYHHTTPEHFPLALAAEAVLLTFSVYLLGRSEIALLGQGYLVLAQLSWLFKFALPSGVRPPWWNPALLIAISLGLSHWWQRQKRLKSGPQIALALQGLYALAIIAVVFYWLSPLNGPPAWLALTSLLAVGITAYGVLTRAWLLAAFGQIFLLISCVQFVSQLWDGKPDWRVPLAPVAAMGLLSFATLKWFQSRPDPTAQVSRPLLQLARLYRWVALFMSIWWVCKYIPERERIWLLSLIGLWLFLFAGWRRSQEALLMSAAFTATAMAMFWLPLLETSTVYWPNLAVLLILLAQRQFARRLPDRYPLAPGIHTTIIVIGGLSLWLFLTRWLLENDNRSYLTGSWAALALILFTCGIVLRERVYRWLGLTILACALGRVMMIDVWKLETIFRVLSFMALGIVLLVLGFVYNKYQEKIKVWL